MSIQTGNNNPISLLKELLNDESFSFAELWLKNASKRELKGLKLLGIILYNNGEKIFKPKKHVSIEELPTKMPNYMRSSYNSDFSRGSSGEVSGSGIFKYQKLSDLGYASILSESAVASVQRWFSNEVNQEYPPLVIHCLRGLFACVKIHSGRLTTQSKDTYTWKFPEIQSKTKKPIQVSQPLTPVKDEIPAKEDFGEILKQASALMSARSIKAKYSTLNKGFMNITSNMGKPVSSYQAAFANCVHLSSIAQRKKFYSSVAIKLLPSIR